MPRKTSPGEKLLRVLLLWFAIAFLWLVVDGAESITRKPLEFLVLSVAAAVVIPLVWSGFIEKYWDSQENFDKDVDSAVESIKDKIPSKKRCPECQSRIPEKAKKCRYCGSTIA